MRWRGRRGAYALYVRPVLLAAGWGSAVWVLWRLIRG